MSYQNFARMALLAIIMSLLAVFALCGGFGEIPL